MKRITLSIITGVCLMVAGQASAHSGHHSHGKRGANETVTVITQPARTLGCTLMFCRGRIELRLLIIIVTTLRITITTASKEIAMWSLIHPTRRRRK